MIHHWVLVDRDLQRMGLNTKLNHKETWLLSMPCMINNMDKKLHKQIIFFTKIYSSSTHRLGIINLP